MGGEVDQYYTQYPSCTYPYFDPYHECTDHCLDRTRIITDDYMMPRFFAPPPADDCAWFAPPDDSLLPSPYDVSSEDSDGWTKISNDDNNNTGDTHQDLQSIKPREVATTLTNTKPRSPTAVTATTGMTEHGCTKLMEVFNLWKQNRGGVHQDLQMLEPRTAVRTWINGKPKPPTAVVATTGLSAVQELKKFMELFNSISTPTYSEYDHEGSTGEAHQNLQMTTRRNEPATTTNTIAAARVATGQMPEKLAANVVPDMGVDALQGLEEEANVLWRARELLKSLRKSGSSRSSAGEENVVDREYKLALELLEYESFGYLLRIANEEDDESLIFYGDKFGLAVLNEYPNFFIHVPQHPHYGQESPDMVDKDSAELSWDFFMPLMKRGLFAVRQNEEKEIAAVERMIARLTADGFDLKHLQAYINTFHRARSSLASLSDELKKVQFEIETESKRIRKIFSSRPLAEVIKELEQDKAEHEKMIEDIESSIAEKLILLEEENAIGASHYRLLEARYVLERKVQESQLLLLKHYCFKGIN